MRPHHPLVAFVVVIGTVAACQTSSSVDAPPAADGGVADTGVPSDATTPPADANVADAADATDGADAAPMELDPAKSPDPLCAQLCVLTAKNCSAEEDLQFASVNACLRACFYYPPGPPDDYLQNTRACRIAHADAAAKEHGHCHHAGAFGIDGCGKSCEGFCQLAMGWCGAKAPFASLGDCQAACATFQYAPARPDGIVQFTARGPTTGDTFDCRMYELVAGLESFADRDVHCPRAGTNSPTCK